MRILSKSRAPLISIKSAANALVAHATSPAMNDMALCFMFIFFQRRSSPVTTGYPPPRFFSSESLIKSLSASELNKNGENEAAPRNKNTDAER